MSKLVTMMATAFGYRPSERAYILGYFDNCGDSRTLKQFLREYACDIFSEDDDNEHIFAMDIAPGGISLPYRAFVAAHSIQDAWEILMEAAMDPKHRLHDHITHIQDYCDEAEDYMDRVENGDAVLAIWKVSNITDLEQK